ncbi:lipase [Streptomyces sp. NRRL F-4489]|uniref:alpha/beta hydrolase n=1 Tax=Streptomyces sp. NRRL F-4489 TaxID=1609095 RepID=UPI00074ACE25|nr:alpha/beta hydrolase [Streptomyces sp. NRRL F-4489]KUL55266.1 lipase [Streptomyces sp. NRRL F-4489]
MTVPSVPSVPPDAPASSAPAVHPELVPYLRKLPPYADPYADIAATRARFAALLGAVPADRTGVRSERYDLPRPDGSALTVEVYRPEAGPDAGAGAALPAVLHFHGGGYAIGRALPGQDRTAIALCRELPAVTVAVEYRLAPEHRYPAGVDDCYRALEWTAAHAAELGIDPGRIAVHGMSAGGGLGAAVALMARDRGGPRIAHQSLCVPDVDDRVADEPVPPRVADGPPDPRTDTLRTVRQAWRHYLPEGAFTDDRPAPEPYAAPARAADLSGLPPASVLVCDLDPLRDAGLAYARRLMDAGVPVTVRNVPGAWHGFELHAPETRLAREMTAHWRAQLRAGLYGGFR